MISEKDKTTVVEIARKYRASKVLLFGSSINADGRDIDLGVEGLPGAQFFRFYGELILSLSKPVDLIDLGGKSAFARLVSAEGVLLYG